MIFVRSFQIRLFGWFGFHVGSLFFRSLTGRKKPQQIGFNIGWVKLMCPKLFSGTLGTWFCFAVWPLWWWMIWWFDDGGGLPLPLTVPLTEAFPRVRRRWHGHLGPPRNRGALRVGDYDASGNDWSGKKARRRKKVFVQKLMEKEKTPQNSCWYLRYATRYLMKSIWNTTLNGCVLKGLSPPNKPANDFAASVTVVQSESESFGTVRGKHGKEFLEVRWKMGWSLFHVPIAFRAFLRV